DLYGAGARCPHVSERRIPGPLAVYVAIGRQHAATLSRGSLTRRARERPTPHPRQRHDWHVGDSFVRMVAMAGPNQRNLGRVFNEVPELYDRVRPGYPDEL